MSLNVNQIIIAGNLTRDVEVRTVGADKMVATFDLACNKRWKNAAGEPMEKAVFIQVEAWGKLGELSAQYLSKGRGALVIGEIEQDNWEDKQTGQKRSKLKIRASQVQFTDSKGERAEPAGDTPAPAPRRPADAGIGGGSSDSTEFPPF